MYALFGDVIFESAQSSPESFTQRRRAQLARHRVVEATERLQWTGDTARTIELEMLLHASAPGLAPALRLLLLEGAIADHLPRPLVYGHGSYEGLYVLESMETIDVARADDGSLIAARVRASLVESALDLHALAALAMSATGLAPGGTGPAVSGGSALNAGLSAIGSTAAPAPTPSLNFDVVPASKIVRAG